MSYRFTIQQDGHIRDVTVSVPDREVCLIEAYQRLKRTIGAFRLIGSPVPVG